MPRLESPIEETNDDVRGKLNRCIEARTTTIRAIGSYFILQKKYRIPQEKVFWLRSPNKGDFVCPEIRFEVA